MKKKKSLIIIGASAALLTTAFIAANVTLLWSNKRSQKLQNTISIQDPGNKNDFQTVTIVKPKLLVTSTNSVASLHLTELGSLVGKTIQITYYKKNEDDKRIIKKQKSVNISSREYIKTVFINNLMANSSYVFEISYNGQKLLEAETKTLLLPLLTVDNVETNNSRVTISKLDSFANSNQKLFVSYKTQDEQNFYKTAEVSSIDNDTSKLNLTQLIPGTNYQVKLTSLDSLGNLNDLTNPVDFTTKLIVDQPIAHFDAKENTSNILLFGLQNYNGQKLKIKYRVLGSQNWKELETDIVNDNKVTSKLTNLSPLTTYQVQVFTTTTPENIVPISENNISLFTTFASPIVSVSQVNSFSGRVLFSNLTAYSSEKIYTQYKKSTDLNFSEKQLVKNLSNDSYVYALTNLNSKSTYNVRLIKEDGTIVAATDLVTTPDLLVDVLLNNLTSDSVTFEILNSDLFIGEQIKIKYAEQNSSNPFIETTATIDKADFQGKITNLKKNTFYNWSVTVGDFATYGILHTPSEDFALKINSDFVDFSIKNSFVKYYKNLQNNNEKFDSRIEIKYKKVGSAEDFLSVYVNSSDVSNIDEINSIKLNNLQPNTQYEYLVGNSTQLRNFTTKNVSITMTVAQEQKNVKISANLNDYVGKKVTLLYTDHLGVQKSEEKTITTAQTEWIISDVQPSFLFNFKFQSESTIITSDSSLKSSDFFNETLSIISTKSFTTNEGADNELFVNQNNFNYATEKFDVKLRLYKYTSLKSQNVFVKLGKDLSDTANVQTKVVPLDKNGNLALTDTFSLDHNSTYKAAVYNRDNEKVGEEINIPTPEEFPRIRFEIVDNNTDNPKIKFLEGPNTNTSYKIRFKKLHSDSDYQPLTSENKNSFNLGSGDGSFSAGTYSNKTLNADGKNRTLLSILGKESSTRSWFETGIKYQMIIGDNNINNKVYASTNLEQSIIFKKNITLKNSATIKSSNYLNLTFAGLNNFKTQENALNLYYVEKESSNFIFNPITSWQRFNKKVFSTNNENEFQLLLTGLQRAKEYALVLIDKNGEEVYRNNSIFTIKDLELSNTIFAHNKMQYTITNFEGHNELVNKSYKMIYSKDNSSYNLSSNVISITESNWNQNFNFDATSLDSGTLYYYKVVDNATNEVLNNFQGTFRTQEEQSLDMASLSHDSATMLFKNPFYDFRSQNYATIYFEDPKFLKVQYSVDENFPDDKTEEFSIAVNQADINFLPIIFKNLKNNTQYFFRIMKPGSSGFFKVEGLEGSFTTLLKKAEVKTINSKALIVVEDIIEATKDNYKVQYSKLQDNITFWSSINQGRFAEGKLIFESPDLSSGQYYTYRVLNENAEPVSYGIFKIKDALSKIEVSTEPVSSTSQRIILKNMEDYLNDTIIIKYKKTSDTVWSSKQVTLADDNNTLLWDLINLEANTEYQYKVEYAVPNSSEISVLKTTTAFTTMNTYNANGEEVTTNLRTYANYDSSRYTTLVSLQEMYANETNWREKIKSSMKQILLAGPHFKQNAWHEITNTNTNFTDISDGSLLLKYIWRDDNKFYGISVEFKLIANYVKVKVLEAKFRNNEGLFAEELSDVTWSSLSNSVDIDSFSYNYDWISNNTIPMNSLLLGGLQLQFKTVKRKEIDTSIPQIFRYTIDQSRPVIIDQYPGGIFSFFDNLYMSGIAKKFLTKGNLLPFNSNFAATWNMPSTFSNETIFTNADLIPGYNLAKGFNTIMNYLDEDSNAKIKFTGGYQEEQNWKLINDKKIIFSDYSNYLSKNNVVYPVKRIIYKDKNKLIGMQLSINSEYEGKQTLFGLADYNNVYEKNIDENTDLSNITWESFYSNARPISSTLYMNPESPGYSVSGITWDSRDSNLISNDFTKYSLPDNEPIQLKREMFDNADESVHNNKKNKFIIQLKDQSKGNYVLSYQDLNDSAISPTEEEFVISTDAEAKKIQKSFIPNFAAAQYLVKIYKKNESNKVQLFSQVILPFNVILPDSTTGNIGITSGKSDIYKIKLSNFKGVTKDNWKTSLPKYFSKIRMSGQALGNNFNHWFKFTAEKNVWNPSSEAPEYIAAGYTSDKKLIMTKLAFSWGDDGYIYIRTWETRWYQMSDSETFDTVNITQKYNGSSSNQDNPYISSSDTNATNASVVTGLIFEKTASLEDYKLDNPSEFDTAEAQTAKFSLKLNSVETGTYKIGYKKVGSSAVETKSDLTIAQNANIYIHELNIANANKNESYIVNLYKADGTTLLSTMYVHTTTIIEAPSSSSKKGIGSDYGTNGRNGFRLNFDTLLKGVEVFNYKEIFKKFFAETRNSGTAINPEWTSNSHLGNWTLASNSDYNANTTNPEYIAAAKNSDGTKWILTQIILGWYTWDFKMEPKIGSTRYVDVTDENRENPNIGELFRNAASTNNSTYTNSDTIDTTANKVVVTGIKFYKKSFNE